MLHNLLVTVVCLSKLVKNGWPFHRQLFLEWLELYNISE